MVEIRRKTIKNLLLAIKKLEQKKMLVIYHRATIYSPIFTKIAFISYFKCDVLQLLPHWYQIYLILTNMQFEGAQVKHEEPSIEIIAKDVNSHRNSSRREGNSHVYAKTGHWNEYQKLKYLLFVEYHYEKLRIRENWRLWKIFKAMSDFIKSRKPNQCRSHHLKMQSYFQNIPAIILYYKERIYNYKEQYKLHQAELKAVSFGIQTKNEPLIEGDEERSNNDEDSDKFEQPELRRDRRSRTSIKVMDEGEFEPFKNQILPKTDETIRSLPQLQPEEQNLLNNRQSLRSSFGDNDYFPYQQIPFQFSMPTLVPPNYVANNSFAPYIQFPNLNFFEFYKSLAVSRDELNEWTECQNLFMAWRQKVESLIQLERTQ